MNLDNFIADCQAAVADSVPTKAVREIVARAGADPTAQVSGLNDFGSRSNYLIGQYPADGLTDIANYGRVKYQNVYDGIDVQ